VKVILTVILPETNGANLIGRSFAKSAVATARASIERFGK
jgi:hypothetical protein